MGRRSRYSPEVRERAVRLVLDHAPQHDSQWAAICVIKAIQERGRDVPAAAESDM